MFLSFLKYLARAKINLVGANDKYVLIMVLIWASLLAISLAHAIPRLRTICLGLDFISSAWVVYEDKDRIVGAIIDSLRHEEDHRIIHEVTGSAKPSKELDNILRGRFNYKETKRIFFSQSESFDWLVLHDTNSPARRPQNIQEKHTNWLTISAPLWGMFVYFFFL